MPYYCLNIVPCPYIAGRQERHRATYDATKDQEEMRKVKRQVSALVAKKRKRVKA